ncbi:MAG TPA: DMT family transporter [Thermomicrobiales bacterium]|nr:DMT family transporter [Thermomicrobiales bacterium]
MSVTALALVLSAAFIHATWNLLLKRTGGGIVFVWLFGTVASLLYAPLVLAVIVTQRPYLGWTEMGFIVGSGIIHIGYYLALQRGYRTGDLSLVYPLARGTGPMLATIAAITFFGERPSPLALAGGATILTSVFVLAGGTRGIRFAASDGTVAYGLLTGTLIAAYTLWDKHAVAALAIPPLVLDWGSNLSRALLLSPIALRQREAVSTLWRTRWRTVLAVAVLNPLAYILVLTALVTAPVSYIAPAREISILAGAVLGARLLAEEDVRRRLLAATAMVLGVVALALG